MYYFRTHSQYWGLFFCIVLIALLSRMNQSSTLPVSHSIVEQRTPSAGAPGADLEGAVSGAIGIDKERGDSVFVVER